MPKHFLVILNCKFKKKCQIVVNYKIYAIKTDLTLYFENNTFLGQKLATSHGAYTGNVMSLSFAYKRHTFVLHREFQK